MLSLVEQHDAVGHALQNALVLHEPADVDDFGKVVGVGVDADVVAVGEFRQGPCRRRDFHHFNLAAQLVAKCHLLIVCATQAQDLRHVGSFVDRGSAVLAR